MGTEMQFEWNSKDNVSFELYKEVVKSKNAQFLIWLEIDNKEVDLVDLRTDGTEYRLTLSIGSRFSRKTRDFRMKDRREMKDVNAI